MRAEATLLPVIVGEGGSSFIGMGRCVMVLFFSVFCFNIFAKGGVGWVVPRLLYCITYIYIYSFFFFYHLKTQPATLDINFN